MSVSSYFHSSCLKSTLQAKHGLMAFCLSIFVLGLSPSSAWANDAQMNATMSQEEAVFLENLTSTEVQSKVAAGTTTILIPIGGTEQTGPYVALGKHNARARELSKRIAQQLGKTLVAPVIAYVPEGTINPPAAHMRFTGTISISENTFEALLESAAQSFKQHGFTTIVFLGDHGGYQKNLVHVADKLNRAWTNQAQKNSHHAPQVLALTQYYQLSFAGFNALLKKRGFSDSEIGAHGGLADTALTLAIDAQLVRTNAMAQQPKPTEANGIVGDPRRATKELGQLGLQRIVDGSVTAIKAALK